MNSNFNYFLYIFIRSDEGIKVFSLQGRRSNYYTNKSAISGVMYCTNSTKN